MIEPPANQIEFHNLGFPTSLDYINNMLRWVFIVMSMPRRSPCFKCTQELRFIMIGNPISYISWLIWTIIDYIWVQRVASYQCFNAMHFFQRFQDNNKKEKKREKCKCWLSKGNNTKMWAYSRYQYQNIGLLKLVHRHMISQMLLLSQRNVSAKILNTNIN